VTQSFASKAGSDLRALNTGAILIASGRVPKTVSIFMKKYIAQAVCYTKKLGYQVFHHIPRRRQLFYFPAI
jgi:hypothetical protein